MSEKPFVEPHLGPAPDDLIIEEIVVGTGDEATAGRTAVVHYVGVGVTSGEEFDASSTRDSLESRLRPAGSGWRDCPW